MPIAFDAIPANTLVPLFWAEVRGAQTPFSESTRLLLLGHKYTNANAAYGLAALNKPYPLSGENAIELFGPGSNLNNMYRIARQNAPFKEIWGIACDYVANSAPAHSTLEIQAAGTKDRFGRFSIWIAGVEVSIFVSIGQTAAQIATALRNEINRNPQLPCYAMQWRPDYPTVPGGTAVDTKIRLVMKDAGTWGNGVRVVRDRTGIQSNITLAERLTNVSPFAGGTGGPNLSAALAALGDMRFDVVVSPWDDNSVLQSLGAFMDGISGRWSPMQQLYGHVVACRSATYANLLTQAETFNDPHLTLLGVYNNWQPPYMWAAALGAQMALHMEAPPEMSRPMQGIVLKGVTAPAVEDRFDIAERNALHQAGIATTDVTNDGLVRINRAVTTYKYNTWSVRDASWRDAETLFQASYFVRAMRAAITGTFPRSALTDEDSGIPGFASPGKIRDLIIHEYKRLTALGLVENPDLFAQGLIVERNGTDATRVDVMMRPDVVNQLRVVATLVETHLQLKDAFDLGSTTLIPADPNDA